MASVRYDEASPVGTDEPAVEHIELDRRLTRRVIMPLAVFAASRVIALVAMDTVRRLRPPPLIPFAVFASWWDGAWYHRIERGGYPVHLTHAADGSIQASSHAFLPLYPLVTRAFDRLLPGNELVPPHDASDQRVEIHRRPLNLGGSRLEPGGGGQVVHQRGHVVRLLHGPVPPGEARSVGACWWEAAPSY